MWKIGKPLLGILAAGALALPLLFAERAQAAPVSLELVLALDVSGSINATEYALQRTGYADAFGSSAVQAAITGSALGAIAVTVVQWSNSAVQSIGWTLINDAATADGFVAALAAMPRAFSGGTNIPAGIEFSRQLLAADNGYEGQRQVIDVSGDGSSNTAATRAARDAAVADGITINGLPIGNSQGLRNFYTNSVIGGPGAFSVAANDFAAFGAAIEQKLLREISNPVPVPVPAALALFLVGLAGLAAVRARAA